MYIATYNYDSMNGLDKNMIAVIDITGKTGDEIDEIRRSHGRTPSQVQITADPRTELPKLSVYRHTGSWDDGMTAGTVIADIDKAITDSEIDLAVFEEPLRVWMVMAHRIPMAEAVRRFTASYVSSYETRERLDAAIRLSVIERLGCTQEVLRLTTAGFTVEPPDMEMKRWQDSHHVFAPNGITRLFVYRKMSGMVNDVPSNRR